MRTPRRQDRWRLAPIAGLLVVLALAGAAVLAWRFAFPARPEGEVSTAGLSPREMEDSLAARVHARDWERALVWARAASDARPGTSVGALDEAIAWHNYAQGGSRRWPGRSATRTSLERIEMEKRATALFLLAGSRARTEAERAEVEHWHGVQLEVLGLPLDALGAYERADEHVPGEARVRTRLIWMIHLLVRPADPKSVTPKDVEPLPRPARAGS